MKFLLYAIIGVTAIVSTISLIVLLVDTVKVDCYEAHKPWRQHPVVRLAVIIPVAIIGPFVVAALISPLLSQFGIGWLSSPELKMGNFITLTALWAKLGPLLALQQTLPAEKAQKLSWAVAAERFCQQRIGAWWLPRTAVALLCAIISNSAAFGYVLLMTFMTYRQMKLRFLHSATIGEGHEIGPAA